MINFGIGLVPQYQPSRLIELANRIENWGFRTIWVADQELYRDCYVNMALYALNTRSIKIGVSVTNPVTRHPAITAEAIATIDELSQGRCILGMGTGGAIAKILALNSSHSACKEAISIIRRLLAGDLVEHNGKLYRMSGAKLNFETRKDIPIYLSASGQKALETAGEVADGSIMYVGISKEVLDFAIGNIENGLKKRDQRLSNFYKVNWVPICISDDIDEARKRLKMLAAWMVINVPVLPKVAGINEDDCEKLRLAYMHKDGRLEVAGVPKASDLVTDDMVDKFTLCGTAEDCIKKIRLMQEKGIDEIAILPFGKDTLAIMAEFAQNVMPAFR